jgi:hypothetical protein
MQSSLADLLDAWHDFDLLIGTAAATLVGLMFVAASIGASVFLEKDRAAMKAFISPTVVHFSAVLVIAWDMMLWIVIRAPTPNVGDRGDAASN